MVVLLYKQLKTIMKNKAEKIYQETLAKVKAKKRVPLLKIIRLRCLDCCCWQENEVKLCPATDCILWDFRMGKNPIKKVLTNKERKKLSDRAKKNFKH